MSEEDFLKKYNLKRAENTEDYQIDDETLIKDLKEEVEYQDQWRREYLERIDKAIEYINAMYIPFENNYQRKELFDILEGKE